MSEEVIAQIPQGQLRGRKVLSPVGDYYSFHGIPYAKPPLGNLRFRPPERPESWEGIRDATKEPNTAPYELFGQYRGDEDCLFLNVHTPEWPAKSSKAVMVWIHGGGFIGGSGNKEFLGPDFLLAEGVVVVTFNYRLGALGFLNLEGSDTTTNNGLRDQVMALTWVKENIAQFGGDPGNVTIFGLSAGGISVHCLMLSPLAEGLFHRAIAMSGTALVPMCFISHDVSKQRSLRLAKVLGCTSEDPQHIADFLRTIPADKLTRNQHHAISDKDQLRIGTLSFVVTEEIHDERFFPDHPLKLMQHGKFTKVPFITGVTSAEGRIVICGAELRPSSISEIRKNMELVVLFDLANEIGTERSRRIAEKLKKFYFGERPVNEDSMEQYVNMASDLLFTYPMYATVQLHVRSSDSPVYVYVFDHEVSEDFLMFPEIIIKNVPGTPHGGDSVFFSFVENKPNIFPGNSADAKVQSHMVQYWTHFAKTGDVSHVPGKLAWTPATEDKFQYLRIRENLTLETDMFKERMEFLDDLYNTFKRVMHEDTTDHLKKGNEFARQTLLIS